MFHKFITILLLMIGGPIMAKDFTNFYFNFKVNNMHCSFYVNDVYVYSTNGESLVPRNLSFGYGAGELIAPGENSLAIDAFDIRLPFFKLDEDSQGNCDLSIQGQTEDGDIIDIATISATYQDGKLQFVPSNQIVAENFQSAESMETRETVYQQALEGKQYKMPLVFASLPFQIEQSSHFSWHHGQKIEDTAAMRQLIWDKYDELRSALQSGDDRRIKAALEPGLSENAAYHGSSTRSRYAMLKDQMLYNWIGIPESKWRQPSIDDYEMKIGGNGRLVQMVKKGIKGSGSPLSLHTRRTLSPVLTYVDGKIGVAWF